MKIPPPELLLQVSNDASGESYRKVRHVRNSIEQQLIAAGHRFADFERILDFGCGVGRLLQALNEIRRPGQSLFGCDVNMECANWCRENLDFAAVEHTALQPPLPYPDASFDLVTAISVFTHLSRPLQATWARELLRVVKPGGAILLTTCGVGFLPEVMANHERWKSRHFAMLGSSGMMYSFAEDESRALEGQREVFVLHSRDAIANLFAPLHFAWHAPITAVGGGQDVSVLVKPEQDCRIIAPGAAGSVSAAVRAEIPPSGQDSTVATFHFDLGGAASARFRSYVAFSERRHDLTHLTVDAAIRDAGSGQLLAERRFAFPNSVTLGPDHLFPFSLDCPPAQAVDVLLGISTRRDPWQPAAIGLLWWDPRIELGAAPLAGTNARSDGFVAGPAMELVAVEERPIAVL